MPFTHSCFISYRHTELALKKRVIQQTVDALKAELEGRVDIPLPVFLDEERLKGGMFYNEALATSLCSSVCMVMLYWPTYFSLDHTFCSREYKAMEELEEERLKLLPDPVQRAKGLIIVIAFRDVDQIPKYVSKRRQFYDFVSLSFKPDMTTSEEFLKRIYEIGTYIAERCRAFDGIPPPHPCDNCNQSKLPSEEAIRPWIENLLHPGQPFPGREAGK